MPSTNRRTFILQLAVAGGAVHCGSAMAALKKFEESEPKAASLGYKHDSTQVDKARFPKHSPSEKCNNCMAFLGKPTDAWGECDLLADRLVANAGWCSSYVKKG